MPPESAVDGAPGPGADTAAPVAAPLGALIEALGPARRGAKEKGVHRLRVATRRVDTWLRLAGLHVLRDDLRWLRAVAGTARDLDVLLALPWEATVRARLGAQRRAARAELAAALGTPRVEALLQALADLPPVDPAAARRRARHLARHLLALPVDPTVPGDVHRRRRALRRVRYAQELLGAPVDALVGLQDALGGVSDLWLRQRHVPEANDAPALEAALAAAEAAWATARPALEALA